MLQAKNLKKVYKSRGNLYLALDNIDLDIDEGEFVGIMGPSGAGKTTLLNVVSTIDRPTSGTITIDGDNIVNMSEHKLSLFRRNKLGFIFQDFNLLDTLTVKENIALPLALFKTKYREIEKRIDNVSEMLGIIDILDKYPYEVSGGQKQRASAARAIIHNPKLILADEPTGALDSKSSSDLLQCLSDLNTKDNVTIMLVTHDAFAASFCKRIVFIKDGRLFAEIIRGGTRKEFFNKILDMLKTMGGGRNDII
ncbi:ABC transporter ATP-binding protein [Clostridiisalibacter paucivorans]|uniref:ABC transporter ATP-binding protein n=1 Tax=Clostridiisalibacter paucivorans TaxID=408753 RepID=UPI003D654E52